MTRQRYEERFPVDALFLIDLLLIGFISRAFVWLVGGIDPRALDEDATGAMYVYVLGAIYLYVAIYLLTKRLKFVRVARRLKLYWIVVAACFVSAAWSIDLGATVQRAVALLGTSLFAVYLYVRYGGHGAIKLFAIAYVLVSVAFLIVGLLFPLYGVHMDGENAGNWRGVFEHKNTAAYALVIGVFSNVYMCYWTGRATGFWGLGTLLCLTSVIMTMSRTTAICILLTVMFLVFMNKVSKYKRIRGAFLVLSFLGFGVIILAIGVYVEALLETLGRDLTLTGRTTIWYAAYVFWLESPWIGHGYQASWRVYEGMPSYVELIAGWAFNPSHSHNAYIDVALGIGSIGLFMLLSWQLKTVVRGVRLGLRYGGSSRYWAVAILMVYTLIGLSGRVILQPNTIQLVVMLIGALIICERAGVEE